MKNKHLPLYILLSVVLLMLPVSYSWTEETNVTTQIPTQELQQAQQAANKTLEQQKATAQATTQAATSQAAAQQFADPQEEVKVLAQAHPEFTKPYSNLAVVGCKNTYSGQFIDPNKKLNNNYPPRQQVPEDKRPWTIAYPEYNPPYPLFENLNSESWRQPRIPLANAPLNPCGRTGIAGRGVLGAWGENPAADSIITRYNPETGKLTVLLLLRTDGSWAIPGGMQDPGEPKLSTVAARELEEETGHKINMADAKEIYNGYSDDWRNTDNAYITTAAFHKHLDNNTSKAIGTKKTNEVIDPTEVRKVRWIDYDSPKLENLFASHAKFVKQALDSIPEKQVKPFETAEVGTQTEPEQPTTTVGTQTGETTAGYTTGYAIGYTTSAK
jgi:ADP-ribose pyrophosphatase